MLVMYTNIKMPKNAKSFECKICNFICSKQSNYTNHLNTAKHIRLTTTNCHSHTTKCSHYICICGNEYKHASSLCKHKKTCTYTSMHLPENTFVPSPKSEFSSAEPTTAELLGIIKQLVVQNATTSKQFEELQTTMKELIPRIGNTTHTNSHNNNTFNIQMFLENECKNAISIQDFVKSIEINTSHLIAMSKDGYVDSISNVLIQALNKLAITDRPLHCTDLKRETVYIKDMEKWNKSSADTSIMNKVITNLENKHLLEVRNYILENPESQVLDTPENTFYHKVHWNSLGAGEESEKLNKKIYKKVLPGVKLDQQPA